jgi:hypothetical protein
LTYEPDDSAERVSRYRRHAADDHSQCLSKSCKPRRDLEYDNDARLLAVALFEALADRGIDAKAFFGDGYSEARELAGAEMPDYMPREPDSIHRIQASHAINTT